MMYMHYCKSCHHILMLNGHKMICPKCTDPLTELRISYLDYVNLNLKEREELCNACADEDQLKKMGLLLETLDDNDDVQNVWHNWDEPESSDED